MILLIAFAFLGGVVTVLSPCILPILPIVLSSSVGAGKKKPLGVVAGFILSFTFFTLFLSSIVNATGISADSLRFISVMVIAGFGLSFLIPQAQLFIEKSFAKLAGFAPRIGQGKDGFASGLIIGLSIGLLWTPCVGPILASVISLALTGSVTGTAFVITFSYSVGTAIPMFAVIYGGRELLNRNQWLLRNTARIQKIFGVIMIITAIGIYFNIDRRFQTYVLETFPQYGRGLTSFEDNEMVKKKLKEMKKKPQDLGTAPEIVEGGEWFNLPEGTERLRLAKLRGKVVLIDFWTYSCINCIRTLPHLRSWYEKYREKGFVIIGVHTPEFEFEKNPENLKTAIADFKLKYPIVQDNDYATWNAYDNRYWPAKYLIDAKGRIRYTHFGEGKYEETEKAIRILLDEAGNTVKEDMTKMPDETPRDIRTPETYLGSLRIDRFVSNESIKGGSQNFTLPESIPEHGVAYQGTWNVQNEYAESSKGSALELQFYGDKVFLVITPKQKGDRIKVVLDGKVQSTITLDEARLYELIDLKGKNGSHHLRLEFQNSGIKIYAFTFG